MKRKFCFLAFCLMVGLAQLSAQAYPDRHSTSQRDAWISCTAAVSPNPARPDGHWIMYDFGDTYAMHQSTLWNLNTPGYDEAGFNEMVIDYSIDGQKWYEFGRFSLEKGNLSGFYQGESGPDFGGLIARFLLISAVSNHGHPTCYGLGEVRINAIPVTITNIEEKRLNLDVVLGPNPFTERTTIKINQLPEDGLSYQLLDINGKLIKKNRITQTVFDLDGSDLSSGLYFLAFINPYGIKTVKLEIIR